MTRFKIKNKTINLEVNSMASKPNPEETEELILELLKNNKQMTTTEIRNKLIITRSKCPDDPARILSKLKYNGVIKGKLSLKARGYIWWI